jgi:hypothetical protein
MMWIQCLVGLLLGAFQTQNGALDIKAMDQEKKCACSVTNIFPLKMDWIAGH